MNEPQQYIADDEIDLLDLLVTVAENIKLLIIGPLVVGLAALGVAFQLPQSFESTVIINSQANDINGNLIVALSQSAAVLDPVRQQTNFKPEKSADDARRDLRKNIKASVGRNDQLVTITATAPTAEQAQQLLSALQAELVKQSQPRGALLSRLEQRLQQERQAHAAGLKLEAELAELIQSGKANEASTNAYAGLVNSNSRKLVDIQSIEAQMLGLTEDTLVQPATLPQRPVSNKKAMIAVVATLASGFALLLFVFVRQALRNAGANPESAAKMARIRMALGLKP